MLGACGIVQKPFALMRQHPAAIASRTHQLPALLEGPRCWGCPLVLLSHGWDQGLEEEEC